MMKFRPKNLSKIYNSYWVFFRCSWTRFFKSRNERTYSNKGTCTGTGMFFTTVCFFIKQKKIWFSMVKIDDPYESRRIYVQSDRLCDWFFSTLFSTFNFFGGKWLFWAKTAFTSTIFYSLPSCAFLGLTPFGGFQCDIFKTVDLYAFKSNHQIIARVEFWVYILKFKNQNFIIFFFDKADKFWKKVRGVFR